MALTKSDTLAYLGALYAIGAQSAKTKLLSMMGGLAGGGAKVSNSLAFILNQNYSVTSGAQPAITEDASCGTLTPATTARAQGTNTTQIFQRPYGVSYVKQAQFGAISGLAVNVAPTIVDEFGLQRAIELKNMAIDMDYTFINGVYQLAANTATAAKTRGLVAAITTNAVAAGGAALSKALLDALLISMSAYAPLENLVILVGSYQKVQISNTYGYAPEDYSVGGVAIDSILTDFGRVGVVLDLNVPADTLVVAEMNLLSPVYTPVDGQIFIDEEFARSTAAKTGQLFTIAGLDYGYEQAHGKITGLKSS
jgi:hypothetical protein